MDAIVIEPGDELPDTALHLREYLGDGPLLILFYTEANTPLCTQQLCSFRDDEEMLNELQASVVAISADPLDELLRFDQEHLFPFPLVTDTELSAAEAFGVVDETGQRAQRAAFVADPSGAITLAIPFYQPNDLNQYQRVFEALGLDI